MHWSKSRDLGSCNSKAYYEIESVSVDALALKGRCVPRRTRFRVQDGHLAMVYAKFP